MRQAPEIDVNAIRKANLRRLIAELGSLTKFADRVEVNPDYLSSILSEKARRNAGDSLMRRVEQKLSLRLGSLDFPSEESMAAAMAIQALSDDDQQQVFDFITYKVKTSNVLTAREHVASYLTMIDNLKKDMEGRRKKK